MNQRIEKRILELEESNRELEMIFQLNSDEIFVTDGEGTCLRVNPASQKHCGRKESELVGKNVVDMVKDKLFYPSATLKVLEEKQPVVLIQSTSNGRWLHVTSTPVFNEEGDLIRVISNTRDITELLSLRKKVEEMEEVIKDYNLQLEKLRNKDKGYGEGIIAKSESMIKILQVLERISKVDSTVLLLGESGVGKTNIAKWIHENSVRKGKEFIEINCGAIPPNLFEAELFGYEPGSFSGASSSGRKGLLELADKGTLFLDEVGELPLDLQTKLLQVIQNKSFMRVGGRETKKVDIRIIAATNQDLEKMVEEKKFRKDLFYRLSVIPIKIPPLRERKEDLIELIFTLINRINQKYQFNKVLSPRMLERFLSYDWPGNVRELENTIERLAVTSEGAVIDHDFYIPYQQNPIKAESTLISDEDFISKLVQTPDSSLDQMLGMVEKEILTFFMSKFGSTRKVAEYLRSSQSTISRKCIKYSISTQK